MDDNVNALFPLNMLQESWTELRKVLNIWASWWATRILAFEQHTRIHKSLAVCLSSEVDIGNFARGQRQSCHGTLVIIQ